MQSLIRNLIVLAALVTAFSSCDKKTDLQVFGNGTTPILSASSASVAPAATDSNNTALTLNWTYANYATDSANIKYTIEMDSTGKNFSKPITKVVSKSLSSSFIAKELNTFLLDRGYAFNVPVDMEVRVISSYANNNERLTSNVVRIKMTPYKIPPKIAVPTSGKLFIVGSATAGGWNNPVPVPSQEFTRIDETTFGGIFQLTTSQSYALLPVNGDWAIKYGANGANNSNNVSGDDFKVNGGDLMAPATSGLYKIIINFQTGKFSVSLFTQQYGIPAELYIVGDASAGGWNNPVPVPSQKFVRMNATKFELASIALTSGKEYLFLPENGNWGKKYGLFDNTITGVKLAGTFIPEGAKNFVSPDVTGNYKITVDFINNSYTLLKL